MPQRFRANRLRLQTARSQAWYAFVLAGTAALALRNNDPTLLAIIVGTVLIIIGMLIFIVAVMEIQA